MIICSLYNFNDDVEGTILNSLKISIHLFKWIWNGDKYLFYLKFKT